ncbi:hypothetical protein F2Q69_00011843 [Brassica cretica]|uniref:Uncharacterized protein n=1 Tax=Brassica cretica TaxID=69181 RepID=A0A8S9R447_BRACR|nr:hypothetical protein F2Q69_00011843 [Brassica cretica]
MQGVGAAGFKSCDRWSEMEAKEDTLRIRVAKGGWKGKGALPLQPYLTKTHPGRLIQTEPISTFQSVHTHQLAPEHQRPDFSHPSHPLYLLFTALGYRFMISIL